MREEQWWWQRWWDDDDPTLHSWMMIRQKTRSMTPPTAVNRHTITPWGKYDQVVSTWSTWWPDYSVMINLWPNPINGQSMKILKTSNINNRFEGLMIKSALFLKVKHHRKLWPQTPSMTSCVMPSRGNRVIALAHLIYLLKKNLYCLFRCASISWFQVVRKGSCHLRFSGIRPLRGYPPPPPPS